MVDKIDFYVIDDSDLHMYFMTDLLHEYEFTNSVHTFLDAEEGLDKILERENKENPIPAVIILDVRMPEMDGFEFLDSLDEVDDIDSLNIKIFMLTSSNHRRDIEKYENQKLACEFLSKPLEKENFLIRLKAHFNEE